MRLGQVRRRPAQHLVLLLQQPDPLTGLPQLLGLAATNVGSAAIVDLGQAQPVEQGHRVHTEVLGDLLDRHPRLTVAGNPNHIVTELARVGLGHSDILPALYWSKTRPPVVTWAYVRAGRRSSAVVGVG